MLHSIVVLFLLKICMCSEVFGTNEIEYKEGTSVETKYTLPLINISDVMHNSETSVKTVTASLARVLNFYNTEILAANWGAVAFNVSPVCKRDVEKYLAGLATMKNWALKMDDASGRYSTGWFWGNHFWTGSQTLCENITPSPKSFFSLSFPETFNRTRRDLSKTSPSQSNGYKSGQLMYKSTPPFKVSFYMLKVHLNATFMSEDRTLHIGLCMPYSCTDDDIKYIVRETSKYSTATSIIVEKVRSQHNRFYLLQDRTVLILCVVTIFVTLLLIFGTFYDLYVHDADVFPMSFIKSAKCASIATAFTCERNISELAHGNCGSYIVNKTQDFTKKNTQKDSFTATILRECLLAFSIRANLKTICDQTVGCDTIPIVHGLKSISMAWVILGHTCIIAFKYSDNMEYRKVVQREFLFQTISNGAFSVDTFFFTSGLLVSFLYFRSNAKGKLDTLTNGTKGFTAGTLHFIGLILYRFARLTAPYLFVLGVNEVCMKWFNYNSIFEPPTLDHINCPKYWWRNIMYINTLFPVEEMCMIWSWYLSDDTQFYIVGAIILILATSHFKSAAAMLIVFMISSWMTTGYVAYSNSHVPNSDDPMALFDKIYDKPWTRLGPYLIGMAVGWVLFKTDCQIKMAKLTVLVGWLGSIACIMSLIYGLYDTNLTPIAGAVYSSLSHSAWAVALAWVVIACTTGHGGIANTILSSTVLYPLSRVTYCAYLLHPVIIRMMAMSMDSPLHLGSFVMIIIFLGQVVASYVLSFIVSIAFEAPVVSMLRTLAKYGPQYKRKTSTVC